MCSYFCSKCSVVLYLLFNCHWEKGCLLFSTRYGLSVQSSHDLVFKMVAIQNYIPLQAHVGWFLNTSLHFVVLLATL